MVSWSSKDVSCIMQSELPHFSIVIQRSISFIWLFINSGRGSGRDQENTHVGRSRPGCAAPMMPTTGPLPLLRRCCGSPAQGKIRGCSPRQGRRGRENARRHQRCYSLPTPQWRQWQQWRRWWRRRRCSLAAALSARTGARGSSAAVRAAIKAMIRQRQRIISSSGWMEWMEWNGAEQMV